MAGCARDGTGPAGYTVLIAPPRPCTQVAIDVGEMTGADGNTVPGESEEENATPGGATDTEGPAPANGNKAAAPPLHQARGPLAGVRRDDSWNSVTSAGAHHPLPSLGVAAKTMARFSQVGAARADGRPAPRAVALQRCAVNAALPATACWRRRH